MRYWLHDLATELAAACQDQTLPELGLDRVWITQEGRAKLLDFAAPGLAAFVTPQIESAQPGLAEPSKTPDSSSVCAPPPPQPSVGQFLDAVAAVAVESVGNAPIHPSAQATVPLPLHAKEFLGRLPQLVEAQTIVSTLTPLLKRVASVSVARRAALVTGCILFPLCVTLAMLFGMSAMQQWAQAQPRLMELSQLLQIRRFQTRTPFVQPASGTDDRLWAIFLTHHYREAITNKASWDSTLSHMLIQGESRQFAQQSVARYPAPSPEEIAEADAALKRHQTYSNPFDLKRQPWIPLMVFGSTLAVYVGLPAILAALFFRGGLVLLVAGVAFVDRNGRRASRWRSFWRALLTWMWLLLGLVPFLALKPALGVMGAGLLSWLSLGALATLSVVLPTRGIPDRLAGTWPVPR